MATYYVSNAANNGYASGSDANNGTAVGTPKLTIDGAITASTAGDTINVNPSGTAYRENSGSNYLNVSKAVTIQTDQSLVAAQGNATVVANATSRVINTAAGATFNDLTIDREGTAGAAIIPQNVTDIYNRVVIKNLTTGNGGWAPGTSGSQSHTLDKCTVLASDSNNAGSYFMLPGNVGASASFTLKGCSAVGITALFFPNASTATALIRTQKSADGTPNRVINCAHAIRFPAAAHTLVDIEDMVISSMGASNHGIHDNVNLATSFTSLTIKNVTYQGSQDRFIYLGGSITAGEVTGCTFTGPGAFIETRNQSVSSFTVHDNTINNVASTQDPIKIAYGTTGIKVYNNTIVSDTVNHLINIGGDGFTSLITNPTASTTKNFGDTSANTYVGQGITTTSGTTDPNCTSLAGVRFSMKKTGSPVGTVTCAVYADDGTGKPTGVALDTSDYTLSASNLTTSFQYVEFLFPNVPTMAYSTKYIYVMQYTGTINNTDYIILNAEGTYSGGKLITSTDGVTYTVDGTNSLLFTVLSGAYAMIDPQMYGNTLTSGAAPHFAIMNTTTGGQIYNNLITGGGISVIFKLVNGSATTVAYNNIINYTVGTLQALRDKGSKNVKFYHNTCYVKDANAAVLQADNDSNAGVMNGRASTNMIAKNNIIYRTAASAGNYDYILGSSTVTTDVTIVNPTIDYNDVYTGTNTTVGLVYALGGGSSNKTWAQWQALGYDVNGVNLDPLFMGSAPFIGVNGFRPRSTSPAIGLGTNLQSVVAADYSGSAHGTKPTVGALKRYRRTRISSALVRVPTRTRVASRTRVTSRTRS